MKCKLLYFVLFLLGTVKIFAQDPGWPRKISKNGSVLVLYQPQVEDWQGYQSLGL